jgi:hypothetical protein
VKCTPDETGRCTTCGDMLSVPKKATDPKNASRCRSSARRKPKPSATRRWPKLQICETSCAAMKGAWNGALDQLRNKWQLAASSAEAMREAWVDVDDYCDHDASCKTTDREEQETGECDCGYRQAHNAMMLAARGTAGRALAARVPLLEATVQVARGLRWVHPLDRGGYEAKFDEAVAALDEKGTP